MTEAERARSADRIGRDIEALSGPEYTLSDEAIRRYAYTGACKVPKSSSPTIAATSAPNPAKR